MDWFEKLTGFRETDYDDTRAKLKVEGSSTAIPGQRQRLWHRRTGIGAVAIPARKGEIRGRTARTAQGKRGDRRRAADASDRPRTPAHYSRWRRSSTCSRWSRLR